METFTAHKLYMVGVPIGNLEELTPRAKRALCEAHTIYAEDTRNTRKLLTYIDAHAHVIRADENTLREKTPAILNRLKESNDVVCYVSDAGMPSISDPGQFLVDAAIEAGIQVEVISGPCAAIAALVLSGLSANTFTFQGFLPPKAAARQKTLATLLSQNRTFICYESPKRVAKTVATIGELAPLARVACVREISKLHEETLRASAHELAKTLAPAPVIKGECVLVVEPDTTASTSQTPASKPADAERLSRVLLEVGVKKAEAAKVLQKACGVSRAEAYEALLEP